MKLKIVSDGKVDSIRNMAPEMNDRICKMDNGYMLATIIRELQAQLDTDQEKVDALIEQHGGELKQLIEQATEKRNRIIKRIFEEIENFGWYKRLPYVRASVQALKQKAYKECGIDG
ncbi:hypothetical protein LCGC14_1473080 [marine sediment metagenome]|uniref:Uncharacterized protein n=1 Tax=marine sediment metagenome TaxID=412755 RepID=A0A0F9MDJ5_9ZZZZ